MPDYGHELRFGSFITPVNAVPGQVVDLAVLSEDLGLDVVTFQDHPYQSSFLDTWTLLTWVAARTSRIHLSANVFNLPLRPPAMLARAVASLDLLSGGRAAFALGTGAFWDGIVSMGGPRRTAAESVSALEEALDIIRGMWAGDDPTELRLNGPFYPYGEVSRGPSPAHDIPIWLGAYRPRLQRVIGAKADGWLPSLPRLTNDDLTRGNRIIDEAAAQAGRDPRDITRLLNVTPRDSAEDLARIAVEHGASVFILASDDPAQLRRFAETTAVEIRERVAEARGAHTPGGTAPARSVTFRDDPVPDTLAARALTPGDRGYARYTSGYFRGGEPGLVLRPRTPAEVQDAVRYAARHRDVPLGIFSGGHGVSGRSINNGGIVIAVDGLDDITVLDGNRVRIGPGATWGKVAGRLAPHGLVITAGDHGGVGVGGLATAGGIGWLVREHGLTIDHLRAVDVVTADGELVHADENENSDLFWGMRGAGANFGVAVSFEIEAKPIAEKIGFAMLMFVPDDIAAFLRGWGTAIENAHPSVTGSLMIAPAGRTIAAQALIVVDSDDPDTIIERLTPLANLAPLADQSIQLMPYATLVNLSGEEGQHGRGEPLSHSGLVRHLDGETAKGLADLLATPGFLLTIRSAGGAAAKTPADATAYAWRDANFLIATLGGGSRAFEDRWRRLLPLFDGLYTNFETDTGPDVLARAFPPAHLRRLRELKRRWDPTGLFRDNFPIDPAEDDPAADAPGHARPAAAADTRR